MIKAGDLLVRDGEFFRVSQCAKRNGLHPIIKLNGEELDAAKVTAVTAKIEEADGCGYCLVTPAATRYNFAVDEAQWDDDFAVWQGIQDDENSMRQGGL